MNLPNVARLSLKNFNERNFSRYVSVDEYARMMGVATATVRQWIYRGKIEAIMLGSVYYIDKTIPYPDRTNKKEV